MEYSKFNDARLYRRVTDQIANKPVEKYRSLLVYDSERIVQTDMEYKYTTLQELSELLDDIDIAIIEEVAVSKFLTIHEIQEFITLRGLDIGHTKLKKKLSEMCSRRILHSSVLENDENTNRLRYYELDYLGHKVAMAHGVKFHKGNSYMPYSVKVAKNIPADTPFDVKRIIGGNRIILNLLKSGVKMERFGVMETVRPERVRYTEFAPALGYSTAPNAQTYPSFNIAPNEHFSTAPNAQTYPGFNTAPNVPAYIYPGCFTPPAIEKTTAGFVPGKGYADCLIRTSAYVKIDEDTVLIYEIVRDLPESYEALKNKVLRYYELVNSPRYLESNFHGDKVYPQLVLCGESYEHNLKIAKYLREHVAWSFDDTILFTEDELISSCPLSSLYELELDNSRTWYVLPSIQEAASDGAAGSGTDVKTDNAGERKTLGDMTAMGQAAEKEVQRQVAV